MAESLEYLYRLHLRDQIRRDYISTAALESGRGFGSDEISVCFADMVGFTRLGERIEADELGDLTGRFTELVGDNVEPPVRLVKLLGDAAMLVCAEEEPLLDTALRVVDAVEAEERLPQLRAGVSFGPALARAGDWYGRPVNLASRITDVARPGTVLGDERAMERSGEAYEWSFAGEHRLKGIQGKVKLFRCRRNESGAERS